jgi:hypothetical protein
MGKTPVTPENAAEAAGRFLRRCTAAVSDLLYKEGYRNQVLPCSITPFTTATRAAAAARYSGKRRGAILC